MKFYRLKVRPLSAWRTPWQADTLAGLLCAAYARMEGGAALRRDLLEAAMDARPRFVLSDAFPGNLLPVPESLRLRAWPVEEHKNVKRARWLRRSSFSRVQAGKDISVEELLSDDAFRSFAQVHNTLDRFTNTTGAAGSLFSLEETLLNSRSEQLDGNDCLSVYARVDEAFEERLKALFEEASGVGFGADASAGKGQFEVASEWEEAGWLDEVGETGGVVSLSTFQPAADDPTEGYWEAFTKYGKVGPDFGLENVFKRPLIMLRPGACFRVSAPRPFIGRVIPTKQIVSEATANLLDGRGAGILQIAYGLTVPIALKLEER